MIKPVKRQIEESVSKSDAVTSEEASRASSVVEKAVEADLVLMNELNQEPWWQSGVGFFGAGGVLWAIGVIITQVGQHGLEFESYNLGMMVTAIGALTSTVGVLYRRFWPNLQPMFRWLT